MDGDHGGRYTAAELVKVLWEQWPESGYSTHPYIVCTGGEPALQLDADLLAEMHGANMEVAIETNGTIPLTPAIDWVCMSPKANTDIVVTKGNELKLVYPQTGLDPSDFEQMDYEHYYLQPMDSEAQDDNTLKAINYCKSHPRWRLSLQTHKVLGID